MLNKKVKNGRTLTILFYVRFVFEIWLVQHASVCAAGSRMHAACTERHAALIVFECVLIESTYLVALLGYCALSGEAFSSLLRKL